MNPLEHPEPDSPLLARFLAQHGIEPSGTPEVVLTKVATAFARIPYENLTKIIKEATSGRVEEARRSPMEVLHDHAHYRAGGTCFALTATLLHLVRALGIPAEPILADRRYGADTHSALVVWLDGKPHLLDPGYLLVKPLPLLREGHQVVATSFNDVILTPAEEGRKIELATRDHRQRTYRLTFKTDPADTSTFLDAWDRSFSFDLLRYPVLSQVQAGQQVYLQKNSLLVRGKEASRRTEFDPERTGEEIVRAFGIDPALVKQALAILKKKGEPRGGTQFA